MNGFYISIKNDLLEKKHMDAMGSSVWLYMWLIDKVTSINEEGIGKVLGGKPIKYEDFEGNLEFERRTYIRYVQRLEEAGYITTTRTPYGLVFYVTKAKKLFGDSTKSPKKRYDKIVTSQDKIVTSQDKIVTSNKTSQLDKPIRQKGLNKKTSTMPDLNGDFYEKFDATRWK